MHEPKSSSQKQYPQTSLMPIVAAKTKKKINMINNTTQHKPMHLISDSWQHTSDRSLFPGGSSNRNSLEMYFALINASLSSLVLDDVGLFLGRRASQISWCFLLPTASIIATKSELRKKKHATFLHVYTLSYRTELTGQLCLPYNILIIIHFIILYSETPDSWDKRWGVLISEVS